jgi:hypothetical protein
MAVAEFPLNPECFRKGRRSTGEQYKKKRFSVTNLPVNWEIGNDGGNEGAHKQKALLK